MLAISTASAWLSWFSAAEQLVDSAFVVGDQLPLQLAARPCSRRCRTRVPRRPFELRQQPEGRQHPGAVARASVRWPCRVLLGPERRRQVELQLVVAVELRRYLLLEAAVGVEPRDFVLVLVGHQLEVVARDRLGQAVQAGRALLLGAGHALDQRLVAARRRRRPGSRSGTRRAARRSRPALSRADGVGGGGLRARRRASTARAVDGRRGGPRRRRSCSSRSRRRSARSRARSRPTTPAPGPAARRSRA